MILEVFYKLISLDDAFDNWINKSEGDATFGTYVRILEINGYKVI